jgi:hypothetical protein
MVAVVKAQQEELKLSEPELVQCIWLGLMATVDWSARPDQIEGLALREVTVRRPSTLAKGPILINTDRNTHPCWSRSATGRRRRSRSSTPCRCTATRTRGS